MNLCSSSIISQMRTRDKSNESVIKGPGRSYTVQYTSLDNFVGSADKTTSLVPMQCSDILASF